MDITEGVTINPGMVFSELPATYMVNYLLIAGGGGSGGTTGTNGGGGGGGITTGTINVINLYPASYAITVGAKGLPQLNGGNSSISLSGTTVSSIAVGGGAGGNYGGNGKAGGSGGGGAGTRYAGIPTFGGAGIPGQGNDGGNGSLYVAYNGGSDGVGSGGGGGGRQGPYLGQGLGGDGSSYYSTLLSTITTAGVAVGVNSGGTYYIGGGGGSIGGKGGGGSSTGDIAPIPNTGGGGQAGGANSYIGNPGATGLVIVYYTSSDRLGTGGEVCFSGTGNSTVWYHVYKSSSTFISKS